MELRAYFLPLWKWKWLIAASMLIATVSAYIATRELPPVYLARATVMVGRALYDPNPSANEFGLSQTLAFAYASLALREPVALETKAALGLEQLPEYNAAPTADGQLIEITVTDSNPELAQAVANELARQVILQSPAGRITDQSRSEFVAQQLVALQKKITETQKEMEQKQAVLADFTSAAELASAQDELLALEARLSVLQTNYSGLLSTTEQGAANSLEVFEPAALPRIPIGPNRWLIILAATAGGLVLAAGAAYLIELLDNNVKGVEEIRHLLPFPILGYIGEMEHDKSGLVLSVADRPLSPVAEGFRSLRTNLEFVGVDRPLRTILVTSANPGDGKTSIAMNLAIMMAQSEKRVILLDADMRRPATHRALGIPNREGLSDLFRGHVTVSEVARVWRNDRLKVITSGTVPPNPTELLSSARMDQVLLTLQDEADIVIIDSPPFFVADTWVLASKVDGVLLVVRPGYTRRNMIRNLLEQIKRVNAKVIGLALNRMASPQSSYGASSYMSYYYSIEADNAAEASGAGKGQRRRTLQSVLRGLQKPAERVTNGNEAPALSEPSANGHTHRLEVLPPSPASMPQSDRSRASLEVLYAISRELATQIDMSELMPRILKMTLESVGATSGSIIVLDEKGGAMEGALIYEGKVQKQDAEQLAEVVENGLAGWVIKNKRPAVLDNTHEDERWVRRGFNETDSTPRSAVSVPLMANDRVVGVLTLVHPNVGHFTRDDLSMLTAIAVGVSANSRIYTN
ncbi:MAG: polysaccharide biosynthesis tyrosine autokinase [Anaerolineales bacterium]